MADPLSIAASIAGLAQATQAVGKLLFTVYNYFGDVKRAPSDVRKLSTELESLETVFKKMDDYGKKNSGSTMIQELDSSLKECSQDLQEVHLKLLDLKRNFLKRLWKFKWPLQAKETTDIMTRVERYKSTFNMSLTMENIAISRNIEARVLRVDSMIQEVHINTVDQIALATSIETNVQSTKLGVQELHEMTEDHLVTTKKIECRVQRTDSIVRNIQGVQDTEALLREARRKEEEKERAAEKRKKVLSWVFPGQCHKKHIDISARRRKGTGKWLWETPEVKKWIADPDSPILWGGGIPGAGKTFLSSALIDHVENHVLGPKDGIAHIYFDYKEQKQQKDVDVLASLVKQLANQIRHLPAELEALYDKLETKDKRPTSDELLAILLTTFKSFGRVFLVFDALDECHQSEQRKDLLPLFNRMSMNGVNLFITSRPFPEDIKSSFRTYNVTKLELLARAEDITIYIEEKIDENPRAASLVELGGCRQKIISELVECAKGMFLLVHFHVKYICEQTTTRQILVALEDLKNCTTENKPLEPTYNRAIENLRSQAKNPRALAINTLSWLVKAQRPLTVDEIRVAVSIQPDQYKLDEFDLPGNDTLLDVCFGLVMIDEHSNTIKLVHYTVQEYLVSNFIIPDDADFKLAVTCITYLLFDVFAEPPLSKEKTLERIQLHPFLRYATPNLPFHLKTCDDDVNLAINIVMKFLKTTGNVLSFLDTCRELDFISFSEDDEARTTRKLKEWQVFSIACSIGHYATVKMLLESGADLLAKDASGSTALDLVAAGGHYSIFQLLLKNGTDLSVKDNNGWTVLHTAAWKGDQSIVQLLLKNGADLSVKKNNGWTALHLAASKGHQSIVQLLLENGADLSVKEEDRWTALHLAASKGHQSIVQLLLKNGADLSVKMNDGWTALHLAASEGHQSIVQLLLENGADLSVKEEDGWTALHLAASNGHQSIVQLLLKNGADLSVKKNNGWTALHLAALKGHQSIVQLLLENGADLSVKEEDRWTALHLAASKGHQSIVQLLLKNGADLSVKKNNGWTALHLAALKGHQSIVQLLLENGADSLLQIRNNEGDSALTLAAYHGQESVVRALLDKGADISAQDNYGSTALKLAEDKGHKSIVQLLLDREASPGSSN